MKKVTIIFIMIFHVILCFANIDLAIIDLSKIEDVSILEKPSLFIFHQTPNFLLVEANEELIELEIELYYIDRNANFDTNYYYLIYPRISRDNYLSLQDFGKIIFDSRDFILFKSMHDIDIQLAKYTQGFYRIKKDSRKCFESVLRYPPGFNIDYDPQLAQMLDSINPDSLANFIQNLEDFETRYYLAPNQNEVVDWIKGEFQRFGYTNVVLDSFLYDYTWQKNVVATLEGDEYPEYSIVIGAHHDSIVEQGDPMLLAPGADDNGSGVAAVLEMARIFKTFDYQPSVTFHFITFAAEEIGLHGSNDWAANASAADKNLIAMINMDMIAYIDEPIGDWSLKIRPYTGGENLNHAIEQVIPLYTNLSYFYDNYNLPYSDGFSFYFYGFPTISLHEPIHNPYYHTINDLLIHLNLDYCKQIVNASMGTAITILDYPIPPTDYELICLGTGEDILVSWQPPPIGNYDGFKIYVGTSSGSYSETYYVDTSPFTITDLVDGTQYFIGISTYRDDNGTESTILEKSITPYLVPRPPENVQDFPSENSVVLTWDENTELDLAGYNVYRSEIEGEIGEIVNDELLTEPTFEDTEMEAGSYYYYTITAQDLDGNESEGSEQIRSRLITLDQGILIVNSSPDGTGSIGSPTHEDLENFYSYLLDGYQSEVYGLDEMGDIKLADLGAYSSIVWQADSRLINPFANPVVTDLTQYLEHGGNLLVSSFFPTKLFAGTGGYPSNFEPGQLIYDYLKIESTDYSQAAYFNEAISAGEYSSLEIDPEKALPTANHHIPFISVISPTPDASAIFLYGSGFDPSSPQGSLFGLPVGIEYLGDDYNLVMLSFPLYYTVSTQAKSFVDYVLTEKFAEEVSADPQDLVHKPNTRLHPNYPNPFNPETTISFHIASEGNVKLDIYNVKGQLVTTLIDKNMLAGTHQIVWDGKDSNENHASSGVYLYRLKTVDHQSSRKMILLK